MSEYSNARYNTTLTVQSRADSKAAGKTISLSDGRPVKTASQHIGHYHARRVPLSGTADDILQGLSDIISGLGSSQNLVLATPPGDADTFEVLSERRYIAQDRPAGTVTRTSAIHQWKNAGLLLLDVDGDHDPDAAWSLVCSELGINSDAARLIVPSASSGVFMPDGSKAFNAGGWHIYCVMPDMADLDYRRALRLKAKRAGLGKDKRNVIDLAPLGAQREVFAAPPLVIPPLSYQRPPSRLISGTIAYCEIDKDQSDLYQSGHSPGKSNRTRSPFVEHVYNAFDLSALVLDTARHGQMSALDFCFSDHEKVLCRSPFRADANNKTTAFIRPHSEYHCVIHDSATGTNYYPRIKPIELCGDLNDDLDAVGHAPIDEQRLLLQRLVQRHITRVPIKMSLTALLEVFNSKLGLSRKSVKTALGKAYTEMKREASIALDKGRSVSFDSVLNSMAECQDSIHCVTATHGSGKTNFARRAIDRLTDASDGVIAVSPLQSLTGQLATRLDLISYQQCHEGAKRLAVCVNSINRFPFALSAARLLIIDEAHRVISDLLDPASTHGQAAKLRFDTLIGHMASVDKQILLLDADLTAADIKLVTAAVNAHRDKAGLGSKAVIAHNVVSATGLKASATIHGSNGHTKRVLSDLGDGRKVLFCADSAKAVNELYELATDSFPDKRLKVITNDKCLASSGEEDTQNFIDNINDHIGDYDGLFYSPSLGSGVSIEQRHFNSHIAVFRGIITPPAFLQLIARDRTAEHWDIFIRADGVNYQAVNDPLTVINRLELTYRTQANSKGYSLELSEYDRAVVDRQCRRQRQLRYHGLGLHLLLEARQWRSSINYDPVHTSPATVQAGRDLRKAKQNKALKYAQPLTQGEYETLSAKYQKTKDDSADIEAFKLCRSLGLEMCEPLADTVITPDAGDLFSQPTVIANEGTRPVNPLKPEHLMLWDEGRINKIVPNFELLINSRNADHKFNPDTVSLGIDESSLQRALSQILSILGIDVDNLGQATLTQADAQRLLLRVQNDNELEAVMITHGLITHTRPKYAIAWLNSIFSRVGLRWITDGRKDKSRLKVYKLDLGNGFSRSGTLTHYGLKTLSDIAQKRAALRENCEFSDESNTFFDSKVA